MPTTDAREGLRPAEVRDLVERLAFPEAGEPDQRGIGLEVELFGFRRTHGVSRRLTLAEQADRLDELANRSAIVDVRAGPGPLASWPAGTGKLTFEPGGQIEFSGGVHATAASALVDHDRVLDHLTEAWSASGDSLVCVGFDLWTDVDEVAQQLGAPRYEAMAAYLDLRGAAGRRMMRHTCSVQVNLDPGVGSEADDRWRLANLVGPLTAASFACSPAAAPDPAVSLRARAWRQLDHTRTGIPGGPSLARPGVDRPASWARFALDADVLLHHGATGAAPGVPGFSFERWIADGHPEHGWPTAEDLRSHLTTLFPEVRPRGPLELRSIDGLPRRWRAVPVVLLTGLLYDEEARTEALAVLGPRAAQIRDDLARAGEVGLKDGELCAAAVEVWSFALEGARRLGDGWHREADLVAAERFINEHTLRGRCPADELRERMEDDPDAALAWASEPSPQIRVESM